MNQIIVPSKAGISTLSHSASLSKTLLQPNLNASFVGLQQCMGTTTVEDHLTRAPPDKEGSMWRNPSGTSRFQTCSGSSQLG